MAQNAGIIEGCIFNLDGVLVNTARYHFVAWQRLAHEMGFDLPADQFHLLRSLGRMESLEKILDWGGIYLSEAEKLYWSDVKNNWYQSLIATMKPDEVLPGVVALLQSVRASGCKLALSSASRNAKMVLASTRLEPFFDVVLDGSAPRKPKPHPECFWLAAAGLGLAADRCLVFDDAVLGVRAALAGGFRVVGIGDPTHLPDAPLVIPGFENCGFHSILQALQAGRPSSAPQPLA